MSTRTWTDTFEVGVPIERVWEIVSDTQRISHLLLGLHSARMVSRDGTKVTLRGTFGLLAPEYDEYPWAFEAPRRYRNCRIFTRGLLRRLELECRLTPVDGASDRTRVEYDVLVEASAGPLSRLVAWEASRRTQSGIGRIHAFIARVGPVAQIEWPPSNPQREAVLQRAAPLCEQVRVRDDDERRALEKLVEHMADAPEADVARMRPYVLAEAWGIPRSKALAAFLHATRGGLLRLSWDLLCPGCEGPTTVASLKDLPSGGHCAACDIDFSTSFEQNVEATFAPEPAVRHAERVLFCHGSPSSTPSWLAQFVVAAGATHQLKLGLGPGRYRVQAAGISGQAFFEVRAGADDLPTGLGIAIDRIGDHSAISTTTNSVRSGESEFAVQNRDQTPRRMQIAHRAFASNAATAADVTASGLYRDLFGGEALAPDQHLTVGRRTILFTDLCGSTAMYERIGDAAAYGLVRDHFRLLFAEVERAGGTVVKTVGDCVMASFANPVDAARAGRACILALRALRDRDGRSPGLTLKVGAHTGSCLAVEANHQVDYFGRTVNVAARVESLANPDELVLSWAMTADLGVQQFLAEAKAAGCSVVEDRRPVKGVAGEVSIIRVQVPT